jgi:hypothetical protein
VFWGSIIRWGVEIRDAADMERSSAALLPRRKGIFWFFCLWKNPRPTRNGGVWGTQEEGTQDHRHECLCYSQNSRPTLRNEGSVWGTLEGLDLFELW